MACTSNTSAVLANPALTADTAFMVAYSFLARAIVDETDDAALTTAAM